MQNHLNIMPCTFSQISDTRWICRYKNCKAVIHNYKSIVNNLKQKVEDNNENRIFQEQLVCEQLFNILITVIL